MSLLVIVVELEGGSISGLLGRLLHYPLRQPSAGSVIIALLKGRVGDVIAQPIDDIDTLRRDVAEAIDRPNRAIVGRGLHIECWKVRIENVGQDLPALVRLLRVREGVTPAIGVHN